MSRSSKVFERDFGGETPLRCVVSGSHQSKHSAAWKILRPERLEEGVHRWPLPVPWVEVGAVNCYVVIQEGHVLLIDTGWSTPDSRRILDGYMRDAGLWYSDVDAIVATHHHADHITQAFDLRREFGIPLLFGRGESESLTASLPGGSGFGAQTARLKSFGDEELAHEAEEYRKHGPESALPTGLADDWLDDGDSLDFMPVPPMVLGTPGHTRGHISFRLEAGQLISGDHLLPHIATSSGLERSPEESPLRSYLRSARGLLDSEDSCLFPAHGQSDETVHHRTAAVLEHHEGRLVELANVIEGRTSASQLALSMQWTRRRLDFSDLPLLRRVAALMEIGIHLDELVLRDMLTLSIDRRGVRNYRRPSVPINT